jgi:hypothetical protein
VHITWVDRGLVIFELEGRTVRVEGEALLEHNPDFLVFPRTVKHWEDGTPIDDVERHRILNLLTEEAARRGWRFEVES